MLDLAPIKDTLAKIEEGEALRRERRADNPKYEPPQAGSIDSSLYLLNLRAVLGSYVGVLVDEVERLRTDPGPASAEGKEGHSE